MSKQKEKDILIELGNYIGKKARAKYKSNVEFASVCDIDEATVRRIIAGKQNMSVKVTKRICEALDIKISDLFKEIGE